MPKTLFKTIPGERFTPYTLARKLDARALLESASFHRGRERYSILLLQEAFTVYESQGAMYLRKDGQRFRLRSEGKDLLDILWHFAQQHSMERHPFPFPAGGVGYLSYEYAAQFDTVTLTEKRDSLALPEGQFIFGHVFVVFDHYTDTLTLVGINYREHEVDLEAALSAAEARINDLDFNYLAELPRVRGMKVERKEDKEWFLDGVEFLRREIVRGNLFQAVLSRRVAIETELTALAAYRALRSSNPSPYMFFLDFGDFQLFGASPEVHVKATKGRGLLRPIAGTRRRGVDYDEDAALERELLSDDKELAEHLMLVDLARNDLGRVCRAGSVEVTERNVIERYSHVMHIVSQVEGELLPDATGLDALRATFPAGTVTGAPKIQAMETLDAIEKEKRGFYAGVVGYMEPNGWIDTCIAIRSAVKKGDRLVLHAGAGVVYDSVPARELEETVNKLRALTAAVGVEV